MNAPPVIVGLGEILWDMFPSGARFGGAPANFACHVAALGRRASMVSGVGADTLGVEAIKTLQDHGVDTKCVGQLKNFPTGTVAIVVDDAGQPRYQFGENEAWDHLEWSEEIEATAKRTEAVCFGSLGQRHECARQTIRRFVQATPKAALRIFDINLRAHYHDEEVIHQSLRLANVLKMNDGELPILATQYDLTGTDSDQMQQLQHMFDLRLAALTRGADGAILVTENDVNEFAGYKTDVRDTVGAGDSFTATMVIGLLRSVSLDSINKQSCKIAAFVCSQTGATPSLPEELRNVYDAIA